MSEKLYQRRIASFMQKKAVKGTTIGWSSYVYDSDIEAIMKWGDRTSKKVWKMLEENIFDLMEEGLEGSTCPFCLKGRVLAPDPICKRCTYGRSHGVCDDPNSQYYKAAHPNNYSMLRYSKIHRKFSNSFYKKIFKQVEKEIN